MSVMSVILAMLFGLGSETRAEGTRRPPQRGDVARGAEVVLVRTVEVHPSVVFEARAEGVARRRTSRGHSGAGALKRARILKKKEQGYGESF